MRKRPLSGSHEEDAKKQVSLQNKKEEDDEELESNTYDYEDEEFRKDRGSNNRKPFACGLDDLLSNVSLSSVGDFACAGRTSFSLPGLDIEGIGKIGLPLSEEIANKIKAIASKAPFGRGLQTLYNPAVRDTWQLPPSQVKITNPLWDQHMQSLISSIKDKLGCEGKLIHAELYKLLLYEKGQHFLPHRDTEKTDGMFATLILLLPSIYSGGVLILKHDGREKRFDFSKDNEFHTYYCALYADVKHQVLPIESGLRLCLVYNLCYKGNGPGPSLLSCKIASENIAKFIRKWTHRNGPKKIALMLEHLYTPDGLTSFSVLKGKDQNKANLLQSAMEYCPFILYLVLVHRRDSGGGYNSDDLETNDVDIEFGEKWISAPRNPLKTHEFPSSLSQRELVPFNYWESQKADDYSVEEDTGNEGAWFSRQYTRAALVLFRADPRSFIDQFIACMGNSGGSNSDNDAIVIAKRIIECGPIYDIERALKVLPLLLKLDGELFLKFISNCISDNLISSTAFCESLMTCFKTLKWSNCVDSIINCFKYLHAASIVYILILITKDAPIKIIEELINSCLLILNRGIQRAISTSKSNNLDQFRQDMLPLANNASYLLVQIANLFTTSKGHETISLPLIDILSPLLLCGANCSQRFANVCEKISWKICLERLAQNASQLTSLIPPTHESISPFAISALNAITNIKKKKPQGMPAILTVLSPFFTSFKEPFIAALKSLSNDDKQVAALSIFSHPSISIVSLLDILHSSSSSLPKLLATMVEALFEHRENPFSDNITRNALVNLIIDEEKSSLSSVLLPLILEKLIEQEIFKEYGRIDRELLTLLRNLNTGKKLSIALLEHLQNVLSTITHPTPIPHNLPKEWGICCKPCKAFADYIANPYSDNYTGHYTQSSSERWHTASRVNELKIPGLSADGSLKTKFYVQIPTDMYSFKQSIEFLKSLQK